MLSGQKMFNQFFRRHPAAPLTAVTIGGSLVGLRWECCVNEVNGIEPSAFVPILSSHGKLLAAHQRGRVSNQMNWLARLAGRLAGFASDGNCF